jgi:phosphate transport system permease protein
MTDHHKSRVDWKSPEQKKRLLKRYKKERNFKFFAISSLCLALLSLIIVVGSVLITGLSGFKETRIEIDIHMDPAVIGNISTMNEIERTTHYQTVNFNSLLIISLREKFPNVTQRRDVFELLKLFSVGAQTEIRDILTRNPDILGQTVSFSLLASSNVDMFIKGKISADVDENNRKISDNQIAWVDTFASEGKIENNFNWKFFTSGDSREPELAGIWSAAIGSLYTLFVTFIIAFPIGVGTAIYLEKFARKNRFTDFIEININNLAAVPSIIFGLLGLAIFIGFFNLPRSAPLVGGLTLALMTLPTIIITSRAAIKAVPPSISEAAIGLGASKMQTIFHHVLPLSLPGILTGSIIGMAQALGETAPLIMIGMVAFIVDTPQGIMEASTALPVQVYLWADSPERGFLEKTSAAIIVLLIFLILMNGLAIWLRQKFEKKW